MKSSDKNSADNADLRGRPERGKQSHPPAGYTQGTPKGQDTRTQLLGKSQETGSGNEATGSPLNKGRQYGTEGNAVKSGTGTHKRGSGK